MHSMVLWPFLTLLAAAIAFVPTIEDSGQRSLVFWLVVPALLAGVIAAFSNFGIS